VSRDSAVLDFGCGWGRMARFFLKDVRSPNLHGMDVDPEVIGLCRRLFAYGRFETCNPHPPAPAGDATYDIVYAYSVFSHLNEQISSEWVHEFSRILGPGGLLIATTQPRRFIDFCASLRQTPSHESVWHQYLARSFLDRDQALRDYDAGKFLHSATGGGEHRPSSFYGESIIPRAYVEQHWTRDLELVDFVDEPTRLPQALIVLKHR